MFTTLCLQPVLTGFSSLVNYVVGDEKADLGNGYYETLLRKVNAASIDAVENDSALKQVCIALI